MKTSKKQLTSDSDWEKQVSHMQRWRYILDSSNAINKYNNHHGQKRVNPEEPQLRQHDHPNSECSNKVVMQMLNDKLMKGSTFCDQRK